MMHFFFQLGDHCQEEVQMCGGHFTGEAGEIDYPIGSTSNYAHNQSCSYVLETSEDKVINVNLKHIFTIFIAAVWHFDIIIVKYQHFSVKCNHDVDRNIQRIYQTLHQAADINE